MLHAFVVCCRLYTLRATARGCGDECREYIVRDIPVSCLLHTSLHTHVNTLQLTLRVYVSIRTRLESACRHDGRGLPAMITVRDVDNGNERSVE